MAGTVALPHGGTPIRTTNTSYWPGYSYGGILPTGRLAHNGNRPVLVNSIRMFCSGYSAARTVQLGLNGVWTSAFTMGSASSAQSTGFIGMACLFTNSVGDTSLTSYLSCSGRAYLSRGNGGGLFTDGNGNTWNGNLEGDYTWVEVPSPAGTPTLLGVSPTEVQVQWAAPADSGGTGITGYLIQISTSPSFATITASKTTDAATRNTSFTGLTPGVMYYVRVLARNQVTDLAGTYAVASGVFSVSTLSGGKRRNIGNTGWDAAVVRRRNAANTGWDQAIVRRRNATNTGWDAGV